MRTVGLARTLSVTGARALRLVGQFREEDHPRQDDGKFGSGSGGGKSEGDSSKTKAPHEHASELKSKISEYPKSNLALQSHDIPAPVESEREAQMERSKKELSSLESKALDSFVSGKFQDMRSAEMNGKPPDAVVPAKQLSRAIERFERKSKPIGCYRGLHVPPEVADQLMKSDHFNTQATSFWSASPALATQFSAGMNKDDREKSVPVVVYGELKGMSCNPETGYNCEVLVRSKTLKIIGREHHQHPKFGTIMVIKVAEAA